MAETPTLQRWVQVRFVVEGFHHWPEAPPHRAYLAARHRHLFHVEVGVAVTQEDRQIEFHDLRDWCVQHFPPGDYGAQSCERLARGLLTALEVPCPGCARWVSVWEDGECGRTRGDGGMTKKRTGGCWDAQAQAPSGISPLDRMLGVETLYRARLLAVNELATEALLQEDLDPLLVAGVPVLLDSGVYWLADAHAKAHDMPMDQAWRWTRIAR